MARLLVNREWYESVAAASMFENDFERMLINNAQHIYPGFHLVPFKAQVESEYGTAKADLALIDGRYREWWVVEVELAAHSLRDHVEPQIQVLATADYGEDEAAFLADKNPQLDRKRLRDMIRGLPPRTLVLVNQASPEWIPVLRAYGAMLGVVEVFRSARNQHILRLNGLHPAGLGDLVSLCRVDRLLPNCLHVLSPGELNVATGSTATITFNDGVSQWRRMDVADKVWLMPLGRYPLPPAARAFRLTRAESGALCLEVRATKVRFIP